MAVFITRTFDLQGSAGDVPEENSIPSRRRDHDDPFSLFLDSRSR
jgi:hypothetical protein